MDSVFSHSISEHGTIAWDDAHMTIGSGFNLRKHQILRSPFDFYQPPTDDLAHPRNAHTIQISQQTFRDQDTLQHYLKSDTQMLASVFSAVSIKASVGCLKSARCSKTSMTVVKRCTITLPAEHFERDLGLTKEAEACFGTLNWYKGSNAQNFMDRYGQYCVTGYTRQSTFFAVSTYSADTKEQLDSFASGLSANFDGKKVAVQAASSFEMGSSKMSHNIRQTHEITVTGCQTESLEDRFHTVDLQRAWVDFLKFYSPIPYMAHVKHYSNLDVRLPHPQDLFSIPKTLRDAAQLAQLLTMSVQSNRLAGAQALAPALESAVSRLSDLQFWIEGFEDRLEQCLSDFNNIRETLMGVWHTRQALAGTLHKIVPWNEHWKFKQWTKAQETPSWRIGYIPEDLDKSIRHDVRADTQSWEPRSKNDGMPVCQYNKVVHTLPGRHIIGAQVKSSWNDGTNGWWKRMEGGLMEESLGVEFKTQQYRGGAWSLTVWSIDRETYSAVR